MHVVDHLLQHRHQLLFVVALLRDLCGHDDLCRATHRRLSIVGLQETSLVRAIRHNPTFWIGEIPL
jgi:hypothetical protein